MVGKGVTSELYPQLCSCVLFLCFETGCHSITQFSLELAIVLLQPPQVLGLQLCSPSSSLLFKVWLQRHLELHGLHQARWLTPIIPGRGRGWEDH
jgi:hypothetical protein